VLAKPPHLHSLIRPVLFPKLIYSRDVDVSLHRLGLWQDDYSSSSPTNLLRRSGESRETPRNQCCPRQDRFRVHDRADQESMAERFLDERFDASSGRSGDSRWFVDQGESLGVASVVEWQLGIAQDRLSYM